MTSIQPRLYSTCSLIALLAASLGLLVPRAMAADVFFEDTPLPDLFEDQANAFGGEATTNLEAGVVGSPADALTLNRYAVKGTGSVEGAGARVGLSGLYETSHYDWNIGGTRRVHTAGAEAAYRRMLGEAWAAYGAGFVRSSAESGAGFWNGGSWGAGMGMQREWANGLSFGFGFFYATRVENSAQLSIPLTFKWKITERLRLTLADGAVLAYDLTGRRTTMLEVGVTRDVQHYRLRDYAVGGIKDVAVAEAAHRVVAAVHHRFDGGFYLSAIGGYVGHRDFEFWSNGVKIGQREVRPSAVFSVSAGKRF